VLPKPKKAKEVPEQDDASVAGTFKKGSMEAKFQLQEDEDGFEKLKKLQAMLNKLKIEMDQQLAASKKAKYPMAPKMLKDYQGLQKDLLTEDAKLNKMIVSQKASVATIKDVLVSGVSIFKACKDMVAKVTVILK
jgi:hypothetical protein